MIQSVATASGAGADGGIAAGGFGDAPAGGESPAIAVEILNQGQMRGAAGGAEAEVGAVAGITCRADVVEAARVIGVGHQTGYRVDRVGASIPGAVLLDIQCIVAAQRCSVPTEQRIVGVDGLHHGSPRHGRTGGCQRHLDVVDID